MLISDADANSFECLRSRAHFCRFATDVFARVLILMPMQIPSNVSARVLISVDVCRMFQLACSFRMQMPIPSNVSARVFISVDL